MYPRPWPGPGHHRFHDGFAGMGWGGWVLWILFMIAFWALVAALIFWLVRGISGRGPAPRQGTASAEQILAERYAHGQIDEQEYRSRLAVLRGQVPQPPPPQAPPPQPPSTPAASV